jgi:hypothetical protein
MSPHRLIQGSAFEPETIQLLSEAYEAAVLLVGSDQPVIVLETIAKQILDIAARGERDPKKMVEFAIRGIDQLPDTG